MRSVVGALSIVLLFMVSLTGSLFIFPENDRFDLGQEYVLDLERAWSSEDWNALHHYGISPLRQLTFDELLVWMPGGSSVPSWVSGQPADNGEWRGGVIGSTLFSEGGDLLVVFEPRLPSGAASAAVSTLRGLGLAPSQLPEGVVGGALPLSVEVFWNGEFGILEEVLEIEGVFWVEPVLEATARNLASSGIIQGGNQTFHPIWDLGIYGDGVVVGIADTGLDRDHSCFRNSSEEFVFGTNESNESLNPGPEHRKLVLLNDSIDSWDNLSHEDARHGTHTAGSIACYEIEVYLASKRGDWENVSHSPMTAVAYNSKLVVQDLVNSSGWVEPPMDYLLWENSANGGVIHSDSWGDNTPAYTMRSHNLDAWMRENPWSLVFVAPGNNGGEILEPANARSVIAVGASQKSEGSGMYSQSSNGPLDDGRRGIVVVAPGVGIISAKGDGIFDSNNNDSLTNTGTSMSTPIAASTTALIQQMVQDGWIYHFDENRTIVDFTSFRPEWSSLPTGEFYLADGFTPSNNLLRALLTLSAEPLIDEAPNGIQGWGRPNLSRLVDVEMIGSSLGEEVVDPTPDLWIWDGLSGIGDWIGHLEQRVASPQWGGPLSKISHRTLEGDGFRGPFLSTGDEVSWKLERVVGEDLEARLSWSPKPAPSPVDDLQLVVEFEDGRFVVGDQFNNSGYSNIFVDDAFLNLLNSNNESTVGIRVPSSVMENSSWVEISVRARNVTVGNISGTLGVDGDSVGFALVVKGVVKNSNDSDGDLIFDFLDLCPNTVSGLGVNLDGCSDSQLDSDSDGFSDDVDLCPGYDDAIDVDDDLIPDMCDNSVDSDRDGVVNAVDVCPHTPENDPVDSVGCWPYSPSMLIVLSPVKGGYDGVLPIDYIINDDDQNYSEVFVYIDCKCGSDDVLVWQGAGLGDGNLRTVDLDVWSFWYAISDVNQSRVVVDVVMILVEKDVDGVSIGNSTYVVSDVTLMLVDVEDNFEDGLKQKGEGGVVWPLGALVILLFAYLSAAIYVRKFEFSNPARGDVQSPYDEEG